jgi:hypothetical protein
MQLWVKNVRKQLDNLVSVIDKDHWTEWRLARTVELDKLIEIYGDSNLMNDIQRIDVSTASMEHMSAWHASWMEIQLPLFAERNRTIKKATNMRGLYLELLRSPIVKNIESSNLDNFVYHLLYRKARDTKRELSCKLDSIQNTGVGVYNDKNIRYINLVITTLDKYIRTYLDMKTAVSVEILRVLPDKYIDRYIMEFL